MKTLNQVRDLTVASHNQHKLREIQAILGSAWRVQGALDVAPGSAWNETGSTFLENARIKIKALRPHTRGCLLADDSGLCVDALAGAPGVHSSSYGGIEGDHERNVDCLLRALQSIPDEKRSAHFYCLILFVDEHGIEQIFEGRCPGRITRVPKGLGGFGYDPIFVPDGFDISLSEMSEQQKNAISHRGQAMRNFSAQQGG